MPGFSNCTHLYAQRLFTWFLFIFPWKAHRINYISFHSYCNFLVVFLPTDTCLVDMMPEVLISLPQFLIHIILPDTLHRMSSLHLTELAHHCRAGTSCSGLFIQSPSTSPSSPADRSTYTQLQIALTTSQLQSAFFERFTIILQLKIQFDLLLSASRWEHPMSKL